MGVRLTSKRESVSGCILTVLVSIFFLSLSYQSSTYQVRVIQPHFYFISLGKVVVLCYYLSSATTVAQRQIILAANWMTRVSRLLPFNILVHYIQLSSSL